MKILINIMIVVGLAGCAIFGVLSLSKNGGKEVFKVSRSIQAKISEGMVLDAETLAAIESTWNDINPLWKADFNTYVNRYNTVIMGGTAKTIPAKNLFIDVIKRTMVLKGFTQLHNLTYEDFGAVLAFPEGVDDTVYWFIINGGFPILGFVKEDFQYGAVP